MLHSAHSSLQAVLTCNSSATGLRARKTFHLRREVVAHVLVCIGLINRRDPRLSFSLAGRANLQIISFFYPRGGVFSLGTIAHAGDKHVYRSNLALIKSN